MPLTSSLGTLTCVESISSHVHNMPLASKYGQKSTVPGKYAATGHGPKLSCGMPNLQSHVLFQYLFVVSALQQLLKQFGEEFAKCRSSVEANFDPLKAACAVASEKNSRIPEKLATWYGILQYLCLLLPC